jgi:hypothetical protein
MKCNVRVLGNSKPMALKRFLMLEGRLCKQPCLHQQYSSFIREYERLGHLERVPEQDISVSHMQYFIPHLPLLRKDSATTQLIAVFDASAKTDTNLS